MTARASRPPRPARPAGYDAGKKVNGRERHALVDTDGRGLVVEPHSANVQDRDDGGPLLRGSRRIFPFIQRVFADIGYAGEKVAKAALIAVAIVRKNSSQVGFTVNPRRWVIERFFAWIWRNRRLAKDFVSIWPPLSTTNKFTARPWSGWTSMSGTIGRVVFIGSRTR